MIIFDNSRIEYGDDFITQKVDGFLIMYATPSKGKITSYLVPSSKEDMESTDENGEPTTVINWTSGSAIPNAIKTFDDTEFSGDILDKLHDIYFDELQEFNPNIAFTNTLKQVL